MSVIGVKYNGKNKIGDFDWMLQQPQYNRAVFIYCDTDDVGFSSDIFGLRHYKSRAFPIPVCTKEDGCFSCLNIYNKLVINAAFNHLNNHIKDNNITTVFYSFENNLNIRVLHEHPFVDASVVSYIMEKIKTISTQPIRLLVPQNSKSKIIGK
jgi:hypothetical protein